MVNGAAVEKDLALTLGEAAAVSGDQGGASAAAAGLCDAAAALPHPHTQAGR